MVRPKYEIKKSGRRVVELTYFLYIFVRLFTKTYIVFCISINANLKKWTRKIASSVRKEKPLGPM